MRAISIIGLLLLAFSVQAFARNHDWTKVQS